jgi:hypothetical protein
VREISRRLATLLVPAAAAAARQAAPGDFTILPLKGLGPEPGVCRRDPSDVILAGDTYYVWYTKVRNGAGIYLYPSGYSGDIWCASSRDGLHWTEQGEALKKGPPGAFDEHGVFTPGILAAGGRYYLFYTAVRPPMSEATPTAIGIAVAGSPQGPWRRLERNPVLTPTTDPALFDSFRVDDACLIIRNGEYWLYYKGRQAGLTPRETKWGLAVATDPLGPYIRRQAQPVLSSGHEVLVWPEGEGVAALVGPTGPEKNTLQYAADGIHFRPVRPIVDPPRAPGGYRPDAFTGAARARGMRWGISMVPVANPYLVRFEMNARIDP